MSEHQEERHRDGNKAENYLKQLIFRERQHFGFSYRSEKQRGRGLRCGVSGASGCLALANSARVHTCVRCPIGSAVCTEKDRLRTSMKEEGIFDRAHRAPLDGILWKQRQAGNKV